MSVSAIGAVSLAAVVVFVAAAAAYLIRIALILRGVVAALDKVLAEVAAVAKESEPIGAVAGAINTDLLAMREVLEGAVAEVAGRNGSAVGGEASVPVSGSEPPGADPPPQRPGILGWRQRGTAD